MRSLIHVEHALSVTVHEEVDGMRRLVPDCPLPFVIEVADKVLSHGVFRNGMWGYRPVERIPAHRSTLFVRPLPLWLLHKFGHGVYGDFWRAFDWLYHHHIINVTTAEGVVARLRDIRPNVWRWRRV